MNAMDTGRLLTTLARNAIARKLGLPVTNALNGVALGVKDVNDERLKQKSATFVTLTEHGALRGCIGSLEAHQPLLADLEHNACAAAFSDPRFPAVTAAEWPDIKVEVSVLSAPERMTFHAEADALAQLRPGVDGVIFAVGWRRATFLPQVWDQLSNPVQFMAHLKQKAGFSADYWSPEVELSRYTVAKYKEPES